MQKLNRSTFKEEISSTENGILALAWRKILAKTKDIKLLASKINKYIKETESNKRRKEKSTIINEALSGEMTWKSFVFLLTRILEYDKIIFKVSLIKENKILVVGEVVIENRLNEDINVTNEELNKLKDLIKDILTKLNLDKTKLKQLVERYNSKYMEYKDKLFKEIDDMEGVSEEERSQLKSYVNKFFNSKKNYFMTNLKKEVEKLYEEKKINIKEKNRLNILISNTVNLKDKLRYKSVLLSNIFNDNKNITWKVFIFLVKNILEADGLVISVELHKGKTVKTVETSIIFD